MAVTLTNPPEGNDRALASWRQERLTGLVGVTVTLQQKVDVASGILLCWKNGTLLDPTTVTISGQTLTLSVALVVGDVFVTLYKARI